MDNKDLRSPSPSDANIALVLQVVVLEDDHEMGGGGGGGGEMCANPDGRDESAYYTLCK